VPFASIVGHAQVVNLLRRAAAAGRVPQSLLISGPEGVGKRTVAIALAQAVNCPKRRDGDSCGVCATCVRIEKGQHSDVVVVNKGDEASIKIATLRDRLLHVIGYRPFEAERRVYIIDPADDVTPEAQAALLKTLEEPPPAAILMLLSAYPDTLLATVQSRCRRLRLGPLSERDVARVLVERCNVERSRAGALAAVSGGSVSHALELADGDSDLADDREAALGLIAATARGSNVLVRLKAAAALTQLPKNRRAREGVGARLAMAASIVRDLGALAAGDTGPLANADLTDDLRRLAPSFDLARLSAAFSALTRAQADLERSASPKVVADWVAMTI
jgi:DNA polymerase-3 subunit delta'